MIFKYMLQPPRRYTFEQPKLKFWVEKWCKENVLNLFAGKVKLDVMEIRNDIDKNMPSNFHMDAYEFIEYWYKNFIQINANWKSNLFDTVILDPPYNIRKAREKYEKGYVGLFTKIKDILPKILTKDARVISFGYDTVGMSQARGFKKIAICIVCHGGDHNDTLVVVEDRISNLKKVDREEYKQEVKEETLGKWIK